MISRAAVSVDDLAPTPTHRTFLTDGAAVGDEEPAADGQIAKEPACNQLVGMAAETRKN
jgi:hypothetical protein